MRYAFRRGPWKPGLGARPTRSPLARGLVAFWPCAEGAGGPRDLVSGVRGSTVGGATWAPSPRGPALSFDGAAAYVLLGASTPWLDLTGPLSLAVYAAPSPSTGGILVDGHQAGGLGGWSMVANNPGSGRFSCFANGTTVGSDPGALDGGWHVLAWSFASASTGGVRFYRDGQPWGVATTGSLPLPYAGPRTFGARSDGGAAFYAGLIGWAAVWSRALSAGEQLEVARDPGQLIASRPLWLPSAIAPASYRLTGPPLAVAGKSVVLGLQPLGDATGDAVAASASGGASVSPGSATMTGIVPLFLLFSAAEPGTYQVSVSSAGGGEVIGSPLTIVVEAGATRRRPAWVPVRADYGRRRSGGVSW